MRYLDLIWAIDVLYRFYPRYHTNELLLLAEDVLKWVNNELPADSSAIVYLKGYFTSPTDAVKYIWNEIQLLAGPYFRLN